MATATLLLPARARFGGQRLTENTGRWLARADQTQRAGAVSAVERETAQLRRVLDVLPRGWPVAAASRQHDAGDAGSSLWLRADPAYVRPDINGARLLSYGQALSLSPADAQELLRPLKPLFGDSGCPIDAPDPSRWYLRLAEGATLPEFVSPEQALGMDLFDQLPEGAEGRRWRALLSEAQVVLHNHPLNQRRAAAGLAPVNSLWFWGAGRLPDSVRCRFDSVASDDETLASLVPLAGARASALPAAWRMEEGAALFDLRHARDLLLLERDWFAPVLTALADKRLDRVDFDFADGVVHSMVRSQRWRFWRRALPSFVAVAGDGVSE